MTQKKDIIRNYTFSDGLLKQKADLIVLTVRDDIDQFATRAVDETTLTDFEAMISEFDNILDDFAMLGKVTIATDNKKEIAEQLRVAIRTFRNMVENKWGTKHFNYQLYKFERINIHSDEALHRLARAVWKITPAQIAELAGEGLTQAKIDNIKTIDENFEDAIDRQFDAVGQREIKAQERIIKGNAVFKEMLRLCNIGKDLFESTDEARYNDYVIYNTPTGEKDIAATNETEA